MPVKACQPLRKKSPVRACPPRPVPDPVVDLTGKERVGDGAKKKQAKGKDKRNSKEDKRNPMDPTAEAEQVFHEHSELGAGFKDKSGKPGSKGAKCAEEPKDEGLAGEEEQEDEDRAGKKAGQAAAGHYGVEMDAEDSERRYSKADMMKATSEDWKQLVPPAPQHFYAMPYRAARHGRFWLGSLLELTSGSYCFVPTCADKWCSDWNLRTRTFRGHSNKLLNLNVLRGASSLSIAMRL